MKRTLITGATMLALLATMAGCTSAEPGPGRSTVTPPPSPSVSVRPQASNLPTPIPTGSTATYQVPARRTGEVFRLVHTADGGNTSVTYDAKNGNGIDILASCDPATASGAGVKYRVTTTQLVQHILIAAGTIPCNGGVSTITIVPPFGKAAKGITFALDKTDLAAAPDTYAIGLSR